MREKECQADKLLARETSKAQGWKVDRGDDERRR